MVSFAPAELRGPSECALVTFENQGMPWTGKAPV